MHTKKHASLLHYKPVSKTGKIIANRAEIFWTPDPTPMWAIVLDQACIFSCGPMTSQISRSRAGPCYE